MFVKKFIYVKIPDSNTEVFGNKYVTDYNKLEKEIIEKKQKRYLIYQDRLYQI